MWDPPVNKRRNSPAIHFVNKTPQCVRARFANCIFSIYPSIFLRLSQHPRVPDRASRNRMQPERERNYFPPDAKRKLVGRSSALNAPEQRLSQVSLTRTRSNPYSCKQMRAQTWVAQEFAYQRYISPEGALRGDTAMPGQWGFDYCAATAKTGSSIGKDFITDTGKWDWHRTMAIILRCATPTEDRTCAPSPYISVQCWRETCRTTRSIKSYYPFILNMRYKRIIFRKKAAKV